MEDALRLAVRGVHTVATWLPHPAAKDAYIVCKKCTLDQGAAHVGARSRCSGLGLPGFSNSQLRSNISAVVDTCTWVLSPSGLVHTVGGLPFVRSRLLRVDPARWVNTMKHLTAAVIVPPLTRGASGRVSPSGHNRVGGVTAESM